MKKTAKLFLIGLLIPIACFSQTTYPKIVNDSLIVVTPQQLKTTNLIFLEHNKLLKENELLNKKIETLNAINNIWQVSDSVKTANIRSCLININNLQTQNTELSTKLKRYKTVSFCGFGLSLGLLTYLLFK